jgi:hypothetical protein
MLSTPASRLINPLARSGLLLALAAAASGCGHPASRSECEEIFRRSAELELRDQAITDPELIELKVAEAFAVKGQKLMAECVGKRITTDAMACVRGAKSAEELDACLD